MKKIVYMLNLSSGAAFNNLVVCSDGRTGWSFHSSVHEGGSLPPYIQPCTFIANFCITKNHDLQTNFQIIPRTGALH